jgi:subfamily B ATP-binding cassette protein MsbA
MSPSNQRVQIPWARFIAYFKPHKKLVFMAISGIFLFSVVDAGMIYFIKPLIDQGLSDSNGHTLRLGALLLMVIFILRGIGSFISNVAVAYTSTKITHQIRQQTFEKLQSLPMRFFDQQSTGSLISKLSYDAEQLSAATSNALVITLRESLIVIVLLGMMIYTSWQLSLIFLIIGPVIAYIISVVSKRFKKISMALQDSMGEITKHTEQSILSHQEVLAFNNAKQMSGQFLLVNNNNRQQAMKLATTTAISNPVIQLIAASAIAIILLLASVEQVLTTLTPGTFMMILFAMASLLRPLKQLSNVNQQLQKGIAAASSLFDLLDQENEIDNGHLVLSGTAHTIRINNLTYYYDQATSQRPAINQFSAHIPPAKTFALIGESGSGKTSLTNLLLRLYQAPNNTIFIDDVAIEQYTLTSLRAQFSLVSQHIILIDDTLANNIAFGCNKPVSRQHIEQAAIAANVMTIANDLDKGLDTMIGENGKRLSGGQRQRIAIARAILRDAPIIILDEATSALDNKSEQLIHQAFCRLAENKTLLIIAHRLSTIKDADCILVMNKGELVEQGNHEELMDKKGQYHALYANSINTAQATPTLTSLAAPLLDKRLV